MLSDSFNRVHDYLRISLTDNCNFRCTYCIAEKDIQLISKSHLMQSDEIIEIARIFVHLGVKKIRLTGGEPLLRKDFPFIISNLAALPVQLGITTNGLLLNKYLEDIICAEIKHVNISIDSLKKEKFNLITQRNHFEKVWKNILICINKGLHVKLNMVVMKGVNDDEVESFIKLTKELPIHIRFIEFMPFSQNNWNKDKVISNQQILATIQDKFELFKLQDGKNDTDKKFGIRGHTGTICFISTLSDSFCSSCNRMRLTADGKMKNCLFGKDEWDILSAFRKGEDIIPLIHNSIQMKHAKLGGQFEDYQQLNPNQLINRSMIKIGG